MVQMTEFRVMMPLSLEEYRIGQMYVVTKMQEQQTSGDEGVEVLVNQPFESEELGKGQYTSKVYHLQSKAPTWLTAIAPTNSLVIEEEAWNGYPKCKTVLKCPYFNRFKLTIETIHVADNGKSANVHNLPSALLSSRKVEMIDIASNVRDYWSYAIAGDAIELGRFHSGRTNRGPLAAGWQDTCDPVMTAYKLVTVDVPYWGFGYRLEQLLLGGERALFIESHKRCFAWIDEWFGLTFDDVRNIELQMDQKLKRTMAQHGTIQTSATVEGRENEVTCSAEAGRSSELGTSKLSDPEPQIEIQKNFSQGKLGSDKLVDGNLSSNVAVMI